MKWIDTAEDTKAMFEERGETIEVVSLDAWRKWGPERRHRRDHAIEAVSLRGDGPLFWAMVARDNLETDPATWTVWDARRRHPLPVYRGLASLDVAKAIASLYAASGVVRMVFGAKNIALATLAAAVDLWRTERSRPTPVDPAKAKRVNV